MVIPLGTLTCGPSRPENQDGFRVRGQIARRARRIVSSPDCEFSAMFLLGLVLRLFSSERPDLGLSVTPRFGGASPLLAGFLGLRADEVFPYPLPYSNSWRLASRMLYACFGSLHLSISLACSPFGGRRTKL
jgi:hypothetical protein